MRLCPRIEAERIGRTVGAYQALADAARGAGDQTLIAASSRIGCQAEGLGTCRL